MTTLPFDGEQYTAGREAAHAALDAGRWNAKPPAHSHRDFRHGWEAGERTWSNDGVAEAQRAERAFGC